MNDLIEALKLLQFYMSDPNKYAPINCDHDIMTVHGVDIERISTTDRTRLEELGFGIGDIYGWGDCIYSYRFGSA